MKDENYQSYIMLGISIDFDGDHTVYTSRKESFSSEKWELRTQFKVKELGNDVWRLMETHQNDYIFLGHATNDDGNHKVFAT